MSKKLILVCALATVPVRWVITAPSDLKGVVDASLKAMGSENLKTLVISGEGATGILGQPFNARSPWWRKFSEKQYVRSIDFERKGWRIQSVEGEGENPPGGGAGRITPAPDVSRNVVTLVEGGSFNAAPARGQGVEARSPLFANQIEYILLPVGFLKTALEKNATVKTETQKGKPFTVLTFPIDDTSPSGGFKTTVSGWINQQGYVERVATLVDNSVLGDIVWDAEYSDWKDFSGVKVPTHILEHQGEPKSFELRVSDVKINVPVDLTPPAGRGRQGEGENAGRGGAAAGVKPPATEDLGDGVWLVPGGYAGVFAIFKDYVVAIEGPQSEMRGEQIISEIKRLAPSKPIRYVVNTHTHFDHTGGLRAFVAEGATILTSDVNKGYYEKIFSNPHTLVPDKLSRMNAHPKVKVGYMHDKYVLTDGTHTIEMYRVATSTHAADMMMAYLPKQKILIEADEFNVPPRRLAEPPARINSYEVNLLALVEHLDLDVERIVPIHPPGDNRKVLLSELKMAAGKP